MEQMERFKDKKKNSAKGIIIILILLLAIYFLGVWYFQSHFVFHTNINGMSSGLHNIAKVEEMITKEVENYTLDIIEREDGKEQIKAADFSMEAVFGSELNDILKEQNAWTWPASIFITENKDYSHVLEYDKDALNKLIKGLTAMQPSHMRSPENASVSYDEESNMFEVIAEDVGTKLDTEKAKSSILNAIDNLKPSVELDAKHCYIAPEITQSDEKVITACDNINNYLDEEITYEFGDDRLVVDASLLSKWLYVTKDYEIKLHKKMVTQFVADMSDTYDTYGKTRKFTTTAGDTISLWSGDYGWWMNEEKEVKDLMKVIMAGESVVKKPVYRQEAVQYGSDDVGDTYIEVDLDNQHVYAYKDGELVGDSPCVTGNPNVNGTPVGVFSVTFKELDGTLTGEDYESEVKYWIPFYGNVGLHDASWRKPSEFGGTTYKTRGSHGCVNLPESMAKIVYQTIDKQYPVIVYGERYSDEVAAAEAKKKDKEKK